MLRGAPYAQGERAGVFAALLLLFVACGKGDSKSEPAPEPSPEPGPQPAAADAGADRALYEKLMDTLPSPCDQPVSLRKSMQPSARCPRGEFAARYVEFLIDEGADAGQATLRYENRYVYPQRYELDLDYTPYTGDPDAPVVLVEFLDYACPACRALAPRLDQLARDSDGEVVLYYKMFPLTEQHPHSHGAARAALAAHQQGEFRAMHERLFARPKQHETEQLMEHARDLGLDMEAFEQAFHDARAAVDADLAEGNGAELTRTPSLFVNGKLFTDGMSRRYLGHWIQEELAVHTPD